MTTRQPQLNVGLLGGLDGTTPAYLLDLQTASYMDGLRVFNNKLQQISGLKLLGSLAGGALVTDIRAIPTGKVNECLFLSFSNAVRQLRPSDPASSILLAYEDGTPTAFTTERFASAFYNNQVWFTNRNTPLHFTDGTKVDRYDEEVPSAQHIAVFYDHLVLGNVTYKGERTPSRVQWSDLYKPNVWTPDTGNEADFFDCVEWHSGKSSTLEVTGLHVVNDLLYVLLPEAVVGVRYVGLPKVMQFGSPMAPIFTGVGNSFPYSSVCEAGQVFFYNEQLFDFFVLGPQGLKNIGNPARDLFAVRTTLASRRAMVAMALPEYHEIWWLVTNAIGIPQAFIYNYRNGKWMYKSMDLSFDSITCVGARGGVRAKTIAELTGACEDLVGDVESLSVTNEDNAERMFGGTAGRIYREEVVSDVIGDIVAGSTVSYITGDRFYGDLFTVKETDALTLSATYDNSVGSTTAIRVSVAIRDNLDDAISFQTLGDWVPTLAHGRLTFPKVSGKIFRWGFTPLGAKPRSVKISAFQEHIYGGSAEV